jgi:KDO2-lipid IV(A) lauroyltransferase
MSEWLEYAAFRTAQVILSLLPFAAAGAMGRTLAGLVFRLTGVRKAVTLDNLRQAFPEMSEAGRIRIARDAFRNFGTAIAEFLWSTGKSADELRSVLRLRNGEVVAPHLRDPRGILLVSGHFGGWEFIISALRLHLDKPFATIVQRQRNRRVDARIDALRTRFGNSTFPMGPSSGRHSLKVLKEGGMIGALGDQSAAKESIYVDFFGRPAATHRGVAALALRTGAPVVMVFLLRGPDGRYDAEFEHIPHGDLTEYSEANVRELTRRHVAVLERYVRRYPDHWLWMHKRWKHTEYYEETVAAAQTPEPPA